MARHRRRHTVGGLRRVHVQSRRGGGPVLRRREPVELQLLLLQPQAEAHLVLFLPRGFQNRRRGERLRGRRRRARPDGRLVPRRRHGDGRRRDVLRRFTSGARSRAKRVPERT